MKLPFLPIYINYVPKKIRTGLDSIIKQKIELLTTDKKSGIFEPDPFVARVIWNYFFNWRERKRSEVIISKGINEVKK